MFNKTNFTTIPYHHHRNNNYSLQSYLNDGNNNPNSSWPMAKYYSAMNESLSLGRFRFHGYARRPDVEFSLALQLCFCSRCHSLESVIFVRNCSVGNNSHFLGFCLRSINRLRVQSHTPNILTRFLSCIRHRQAWSSAIHNSTWILDNSHAPSNSC